jgi:capsular exopolysaccharide synthesis family protein
MRSGGAEWGPPAPHHGQLLSLADVAAAMKRSFWIILACPLIAVAVAVIYVLGTSPGYVATAQLMIEPAKQQLFWQDNSMLDLTVDSAQVESQVELLRSERILGDVIGSLGLANDSEVRSDATLSEHQRQNHLLNRFRNALTTRRIGQSYVIEVSFLSTAPEKAARIANAIADAYMRDQRRAKADVARQASDWMQQRVEEVGIQLNAAAAAVQKFRATNGISGGDSNNQLRLLDQLTELEARAEAYRKLYEGFVQRLTENRQQETYPVTIARVIAAASTPLVPAYPRTKLILALALLLGIFAGCGIAAARAMLDDTVSSIRQLREALGLDCLTTLPRLHAGPREAYRRVLSAPFSRFADSIRCIKLALQNTAAGAASEDGPGLTIGVISLGSGEGKTTVAVNLAALFAASGRKTLLVDGNFRHSALSHNLLPSAKQGLLEGLAGDWENVVGFDPETMVHVLPVVVNGAGVPNSADLLGSPAMQRMLQQLEGSFGTILVDLPALTNAVDALAIGPLLDGCLLVVEWRRTRLEPLAEAVELLRASRIRLLGVVLNKVDDGIPAPFSGGVAMARWRAALSDYKARPIEAGP